jgi:glycosyltransferase involved in cell wall biosynthesis
MSVVVSFVIPTLNAERLLGSCLDSIRRQDFPSDAVEILVADAASQDRTVEVARQYGARVLDAGGLLAEAAKRRAFEVAEGRYLALLDADNEIVGVDWLARAVSALDRHPEALGFESYYLKCPHHSQWNRYLTSCLQISDPYARFLAGRLRLRALECDGLEVYELPADGSYPTGANGFVFPKRWLNEMPADLPYHEAVFFPELMRKGIRTLLKIRGCGIWHHYVSGWRDFFRKRQRAMIIRSLRREQVPNTWDAGGWGWKWLALLYFSTTVGPAIEGVVRAICTRDPDWLLHPLAGWVSTAGNLVGMIRAALQADRRRRERLSQELHQRIRPGAHP